MHISDFDYQLPPERIAQKPLPERDGSRLLVADRKRDTIEHRHFRDLPELLRAGDRLVVNDTRVIPARIFGQREGGTTRVELLLLKEANQNPGHTVFTALARPARKLTRGTIVTMGTSAVPVTIIEEVDDKKRMVEFPPGFSVPDFLRREGHVPLPPYIRREDDSDDRERYQTIFAEKPGAVAAPTAGLHFTQPLLAELEQANISVTAITLQVGLGTFSPVVEPDPRAHKMESEFYSISEPAAGEITATRREGGRIVAVGTTAVRTLETAVERGSSAAIQAGEGWTRKFIYPPYAFQMVDALITNFHLPRSTLLMLVSAFAGLEFTRRVYEEAIRREYRFYSYGDAMLVV